jgi:hypothetical protein
MNQKSQQKSEEKFSVHVQDLNRHTGSTQRTVLSRPSSTDSSLQLNRTQQAATEDFILCGVVTATFRVLSLFIVMKCYSYIESVTTNCSSAWWLSNKLSHWSKPTSKVTTTCDNIWRNKWGSMWGGWEWYGGWKILGVVQKQKFSCMQRRGRI